jgi:16S rRNA (uracil1498-N3)-methyltransferase
VVAFEPHGRNSLPEISPPVSLRDYLRTDATGAAHLRLLFAPEAQQRRGDMGQTATPVSVLVGPEGGLTGEEEQTAVAAGFTPVRLGPRVLRTETAAIVALALLQREFGDL